MSATTIIFGSTGGTSNIYSHNKINFNGDSGSVGVVGKYTFANMDSALGGNNLMITAGGVLSKDTSLAKYKYNIRDINDLGDNFKSDLIYKLTPRSFEWTTTGESDFGFVAEEVAKIHPQFAVYSDGIIMGVKYDKLVSPIIAEMIKLRDELYELRMFYNSIVDI